MALISIKSLKSHLTYYPVQTLVDRFLQQTYKHNIPQDNYNCSVFTLLLLDQCFKWKRGSCQGEHKHLNSSFVQLSILNTGVSLMVNVGKWKATSPWPSVFQVLFPNIPFHKKPFTRDKANYDARIKQIIQIPCVHLLPFSKYIISIYYTM